MNLALKIKKGEFKRISNRYSEELMRTIKWMLKVDPKHRPNVEDLLNLPHISMKLRERALKKNMTHLKKKEDDVRQKENQLRECEEELKRREMELEERERQVDELERSV